MKVIGLTGNIGSGKSEIAKLFVKFQCKIIDLDAIGHQVLLNPQIKKKIIKKFGKNVLANNQISRKKLGEIVFKDEKKLIQLNAELHPMMIKSLKQEINKYKKLKYKLIVIDAALLFEMNLKDLCDLIVTVYTTKLISFLRIKRKRNISFAQFNRIYKSQYALDKKIAQSHFIINNNLPLFLNINNIKKIILKTILD